MHVPGGCPLPTGSGSSQRGRQPATRQTETKRENVRRLTAKKFFKKAMDNSNGEVSLHRSCLTAASCVFFADALASFTVLSRSFSPVTSSALCDTLECMAQTSASDRNSLSQPRAVRAREVGGIGTGCDVVSLRLRGLPRLCWGSHLRPAEPIGRAGEAPRQQPLRKRGQKRTETCPG